jgi:hypothetical protein
MAASEAPKSVVYLHHTRDKDGDVVFFFLDREKSGTEPVRSSPVLGIRRCHSAVLDVKGHGRMGRYVVTTQNTVYEVQMPLDKADHLAKELGGFEIEPPRGTGP